MEWKEELLANILTSAGRKDPELADTRSLFVFLLLSFIFAQIFLI